MQAKQIRWLWIILVPLVLASVHWQAAAGEEDPSQDKVAVVNGSVITKKSLDRELKAANRRFGGMGKALTESQSEAIKKETLEGLIQHELLYQESQKQGIKIDQETVDGMFKKRFPDEEQFKRMMSGMNVTEAEIKTQFMKGTAIRELVDKEVGEKVTVSDKETKAYYDANKESFKEPEQVRASHILIKVDPKAEASQKAETRKRVEEIQERLKKGEEFSTLAKEFSQCPSSAKGGDLGYFRRGQMVKPFDEVAFALKPGELSDIVETKFGYHLIKVMDKKAPGTASYEEVKPRIEQNLKREKFQKEFSLYTEKLKEKAKIERFLEETAK